MGRNARIIQANLPLMQRDGLNALCSPTYRLLQKPAAPAAVVQHIDNFGKAAKHLLSEVPTTHTSMFTNDGITT